MAHTFEELKEKTIAELRDIAKDIQSDDLKGYSQLNKEQLLPIMCKALGIPTHGHHAAGINIDKGKIKAKIKALKVKKGKALEGKDFKQLKLIRHEVHRLKHELRKAIV